MNISRTSLRNIVHQGFLAPEQADQLNMAGVEDGPDLVRTWRNPAERQRLAQAIEMPVTELMRAVFVANLLMQEAPGKAGIDVLLQHEAEGTIREFKDVDDDHKFVCANRQVILEYAGMRVYNNWVMGNSFTYRPINKTLVWMLGLMGLALLGVIAVTFWIPLSGNFGPDIMSQLAQALGRREALLLAGLVVIPLGGGGAILMGSLPLINRIGVWFDNLLDHMMGRTPRDVLVLVETQAYMPPIWLKVNRILDGSIMWVWTVPMVAGIFLPGYQVWFEILSCVLLCSWMLLKIKGVSVRFSQTNAAWANQARASQAGFLLAKASVNVLLVGFAFSIWITSAGLMVKGVDKWSHTQIQAAYGDLQNLLAHRTLEATDPSIEELEQFTRETTQNWQPVDQTMLGLLNSWFSNAMQFMSLGIFSILAGAVSGWFIFIRHQRWIKAFLLVAIAYLALEIAPELSAWWLFQASQINYDIWKVIVGFFQILLKTVVNNSLGLTIGLFFAIGQEIFNIRQEGHLEYECPKCHVLMARPTCECGRKRGFQKVLDLE